MSNHDLDKWYHILELEPGASFEEVRNHWRVLCQVWHPDKHAPGSQAHKLAQEKQKLLNNAYDHLKQHFETTKSASATTSPKAPQEAQQQEAQQQEAQQIDSSVSELLTGSAKKTPPPSPPPPPSSSSSSSRSPGTSLMPLPNDLAQGGAVISVKKQPTIYLAFKELLYSFYLALAIDKPPIPPDSEPTFWNISVAMFILFTRRMILAAIAIGLCYLVAPTWIGIPICFWLIWHFTFDLRPEFQRRAIIETPYMFTTHFDQRQALDLIAKVLGSPNGAGNQWDVKQTDGTFLQAKLQYLDNSLSSELDLLVTVYSEPPFCLVKLEFSLAGCGATPLAEKIISFTVPAVRKSIGAEP